jgi:hypothetical protein
MSKTGGLVCLVSMDRTDPGVAGVACDAPNVAAKRGIYLVKTDRDGTTRGGLLLRSEIRSARVYGRVTEVDGRTAPLVVPPNGGVVNVEPEGSAGTFTLKFPPSS